jgi:transposase
MAIVNLSSKERQLLETFTVQTSRAKALRRAQALLRLDEGESVEEITQRLAVSRRTVYYWVEHVARGEELEGASRLADALRSGRPPTARGIIEPLIAEVIEAAPREWGYRSTGWTAPLLRQYLGEYHQVETSRRSVSDALERLGIIWKRPRPELSRCSPTWRQAKGGSNGGLLAATARSALCWTRPSARELRHSTVVMAELVSKSAAPLLGTALGGSCRACSLSPRGRSCSSSPTGGMSKPISASGR